MKYSSRSLNLLPLLCTLVSASSAFQQQVNGQVDGGVSPINYKREDGVESVQFFEPPNVMIKTQEELARKPAPVVIPPPPVLEEVRQQSRVIKMSTKQAAAFGMLLALTSGFVNGSTLSGIFSKAQASVALTGTWTNSAVHLARGNTAMFSTSAQYILSYIAGSALGGLSVPKPVPMQIDNPKGVALAFSLTSMVLMTAGVLAGAAGTAGQGILCLCLLASGIQNSVTSSLSANMCRTTHLTGITSDIGTFIGQNLRGNHANLTKLKVFPLLALSFWAGGYLSLLVAEKVASNTLLIAASVPAVLAASLGAHCLKTRSPKVAFMKVA